MDRLNSCFPMGFDKLQNRHLITCDLTLPTRLGSRRLDGAGGTQPTQTMPCSPHPFQMSLCIFPFPLKG